MWLLGIKTKKLQHFVDETACPPYAILSHTWTEDERSFKEVHDLGHSSAKIDAACGHCVKDGYSHIWIDTCCIDKSSSAEMSEAINSMYRWYKAAAVCYVYLGDYDIDQRSLGDFEGCRWFTRGWTLQELIAPRELVFLDCAWRRIGTKTELLSHLHQRITGVDPLVLYRPVSMRRYSVAKRMSWAAWRQTTRPEDRAYSLLGIFEVNMPLLYGEGENAFIRLQEEIMKRSTDTSILAWRPSDPQQGDSLLATSPDDFRDCGFIQRVKHTAEDADESFEMTNSGLKISLPIREDGLNLYASLSCAFMPAPGREYPWPVLRSQRGPTAGARMTLMLRIEPANSLYSAQTRVFHIVGGSARLAIQTHAHDVDDDNDVLTVPTSPRTRPILLRRHRLDPDILRGPRYELHLTGITHSAPFHILNSYPVGKWDLKQAILSYDGTEYTYACVEVSNSKDIHFFLGIVVHPRIGDLAQQRRAKASLARLSIMVAEEGLSLSRVMGGLEEAGGEEPEVVCGLGEGRGLRVWLKDSVDGPLTVVSEVVVLGEKQERPSGEGLGVRRVFHRTKTPR